MIQCLNTRVEVHDASNLRQQTFTVEAWVHPRGVGSTFDFIGAVVVSKFAPNHPSFMITGPGANGGMFRFSVRTAAGGENTLFTANDFPFNNWYHVAMTWDGSILKGYVNGNLEGSFDLGPSTVVYENGGALMIGSHNELFGWSRR